MPACDRCHLLRTQQNVPAKAAVLPQVKIALFVECPKTSTIDGSPDDAGNKITEKTLYSHITLPALWGYGILYRFLHCPYFLFS